MHPVLGQLVRRVEKDWRRARYAAKAFPAIAASAMVELKISDRLDPVELLRSMVVGDVPGEARVGHHPSPGVLPLFLGPRFAVHLHAWRDNVGEPHSHTWSGAYQVLQGVCVTGFFRFQEKTRIDPKVRLGRLSLIRLELQTPGSTAAVEAGPATIHGQSYADRPGLSISIRTQESWGFLTYSYWHPGLAVETELVDEQIQRLLKSLDALFALNARECRRLLGRLMRAADLRTALLVLQHVQAQFAGEVDVDELVQQSGRGLKGHRDLLLGALADMRRKRAFEARREGLTQWDGRFLLSALYLAPDRLALRRLLRTQYPRKDPEEVLREVLVGLASTAGEDGKSLLGTPVDEDLPILLGVMLEDDRPQAVLKGLTRFYSPADVRQNATLLRQTVEGLRALPVLLPLWRRQS